ncbi:hypothetical protein FSST1_010192 [Fusarium sambucinum]
MKLSASWWSLILKRLLPASVIILFFFTFCYTLRPIVSLPPYLQSFNSNRNRLYCRILYELPIFGDRQTTTCLQRHPDQTMAITGGSVPNLKSTRKLPQSSKFGTQQADYHITVDHESAFTCTQCANVDWMRNIAFGRPGHRSVVKNNIRKKKHPFKPFTIQMPGLVVKALTRLYDAIDNDQATSQWIKSVKLGTNIATGHIYPLHHGTCRKSNFISRYMDLWLYPISRKLLEAASKALEAKEPLSEDMIDGRYWMSSQHYPNDEGGLQSLGGIYTDSEDSRENFIQLTEFCTEYLEELVP